MSKFLSPKREGGKAKPFTNSNRNDLIKHYCPNMSALQTDQVLKEWIEVPVSILSPPKGFSLKLKLKLCASQSSLVLEGKKNIPKKLL